jgi:hypothetical protein
LLALLLSHEAKLLVLVFDLANGNLHDNAIPQIPAVRRDESSTEAPPPFLSTILLLAALPLKI